MGCSGGVLGEKRRWWGSKRKRGEQGVKSGRERWALLKPGHLGTVGMLTRGRWRLLSGFGSTEGRKDTDHTALRHERGNAFPQRRESPGSGGCSAVAPQHLQRQEGCSSQATHTLMAQVWERFISPCQKAVAPDTASARGREKSCPGPGDPLRFPGAGQVQVHPLRGRGEQLAVHLWGEAP